MTHVKRFQGIPMSKSMRGLCKEEDYVFLGTSEKMTKEVADRERVLTDRHDWQDKKDERVCRQLKWEQQEKQRLQEIEESKKEKELQWQSHVAKLTSIQEKNLKDRLARIRRFREFQRKVLVQESGMDGGASGITVDQLLTRI